MNQPGRKPAPSEKIEVKRANEISDVTEVSSIQTMKGSRMKSSSPLMRCMPETSAASGQPVVSWTKVSGAAQYEVYRSTNGKNFVNYNNPAYDALYAQAQACTDDAQQTAIYKQLETMLTETAANLYLQDLANLVAIRSDLTGYQFYPIYAMDFSTVAYSK